MPWLVRYLLYSHGGLSSDLQHRSWTEAGGMAHQLRVCAVLVEDLGWVFRTQVKRLTTVYKSGLRGSDTLFWSLWHLYLHAHIPTQAQKHIYNLKQNSF